MIGGYDMKKSMYACKILAIVTAMVLVMSSFSACTDKSTSSDAAGQQNTVSEKTEAKSEDSSKTDDTGKNDVSAEKTEAKSETTAKDDTVKAEAESKTEDGTAGAQDKATAAPAVDTIKIKTENESGYSKQGGVITITSAGEYKFKGELSDGRIIVDAKDQEVVIELNGVDITCSYDSVIYVEDADKVTVKACEGTNNILRDTRPRRVNEDDETGSACIYSKDDLDIQGKGLLEIEASYNNGIQSKNDIKIKNLTLTVTCPNNCIKGNDSLTIESGFITVTSLENDGLKTKNTDVSAKGKQRGIITISGGTVTINAPGKCINAAFGTEIADTATVIKNDTE